MHLQAARSVQMMHLDSGSVALPHRANHGRCSTDFSADPSSLRRWLACYADHLEGVAQWTASVFCDASAVVLLIVVRCKGCRYFVRFRAYYDWLQSLCSRLLVVLTDYAGVPSVFPNIGDLIVAAFKP